jgi:glycosyltransferase involved in cell wall biosynthesis
MKILYDHQTFSIQEYGGISRIYTELLKYSSASQEIETDISLLFSNNAYLKEVEGKRIPQFFPRSHFRYKPQLLYKLNNLYSRSELKKRSFDVFHPTYYDPYFLRYLKNKPFVVTFLDLIHEKFADRYRELANDKVIFERKKVLLQEAAKIIAISESTKNDIVDIFGTAREKIEVIHLANSLHVPDGKKTERLVQDEYILFVGKREAYKNFQFLLTSIQDILRSNDLKLVCSGGGKFTSEEMAFINELGLRDKVLFFPVANDATLVKLYSHAICFVFPSLYEGFGIPVLEAFACGCPILLSDRGSLTEVAGDAVIYCDPEDAQSIQKGLSQYLFDSDLRQAKALQGYERLKQFSWSKTSEETFNLYGSLL